MRRLAIRTLLTLLFALVGTTSGQAKTVETKTTFGLVELVQEVRTRDPGEPEIMHVATEWTKLRLVWKSRDGDLTVRLEDDGQMLDVYVEGHECATRAPFQRYALQVGETGLWNSAMSNMRSIVAACPRITAQQKRSYVREISLAQDDFVPAVEALKSRARVVFQTDLKRCRPQPARSQDHIMTFDHFGPDCSQRW